MSTEKHEEDQILMKTLIKKLVLYKDYIKCMYSSELLNKQ